MLRKCHERFESVNVNRSRSLLNDARKIYNVHVVPFMIEGVSRVQYI